MKKICFYTGSLNQGGVERDISILSSTFAEKQFDVYIITVFSSKNFFNINSKVHIINLSNFVPDRSFRSIKILKKKIKQLQHDYCFDFVISNMIGLNFILYQTLKHKNCKLIFRIASNPARWKFIYRVMAKIYYKKAYCVIAQTNYQLTYFGRKLSKNGVVIPNVCDYDYQFDYSVNFKSNDICYIGRLNYYVKRLDLLVLGFLKIHEKYPLFKMHLIGMFPDNKHESLTRELIKKYEATEYILIEGSSANVFEDLSKSFCYVFSSPSEGMPNSVLESQTCGIPVVTSNFCGVDEIINDKIDGLIYPFGDYNRLSECVKLLKTDFDLYKKISLNGIKRKTDYKLETVIGKWEDVFEH